MSFEAWKWGKTWGDGLSSNRRFVFLLLCDHYNEEAHRAWPSMETLARETGMSARTVARCVVDLERLGLIDVEPWINAETGKQLSNRYCIPLYDQDSCRAATLPVRVYRRFTTEGGAQYSADVWGEELLPSAG